MLINVHEQFLGNPVFVRTINHLIPRVTFASVQRVGLAGVRRSAHGGDRTFLVSTPAGEALYQMLGVFSQFERAIIRERVNAGLARVKAQGKKFARPRRDDPKLIAQIRKLRKQGTGILKIARETGTGTGLVQRVLAEAR